MTTPSLTIVVTARHDNYGGDAEERILKPLQFNAARLAEHGVDYEVVLVEWDPLPGRPLLSELVATRLPELAERTIRRIVVAPEYQQALTQNPLAGYMEYLAKNVGIRRAAAPFVLVSNVDILLGRTVVETLAAGRLVPGTIYRAPRWDTKLGLDQTRLTWDALENPDNYFIRPALRPPLYSSGSGDFILADRDTLHRLRGFNEVYRAARAGVDQNLLAKARGAGHPIAVIDGPVYHVLHTGSFRVSGAAYEDSADTPWGNLGWHASTVTYNNPDGWGLGEAPARRLPDGATYLDFDWKAVPPLIELRRIVLPASGLDADRPNRDEEVSGESAQSIDPLTRIAIRCGTDKWGPHFYTPIYHELLKHWRGRPVNVLEIGVGGHESGLIGGASLRMWVEYFPQGRIVGIDIAEKRLRLDPRITILRGSQTDPDFLETVVAEHGPFDVIIDDGSHRPKDVAASFELLFPSMADGGLYIVEDAQTAFWPEFGGSPEDGAETMGLARSALLAINHKEVQVAAPDWQPPPMAPIIRSVRAYHNLLIFERGDNRAPSSVRYDFESPHATHALTAMERELAQTPTPEGLARLARTYLLGRRHREALDAIQRGLALWPNHIQLLTIGEKAAQQSGDTERHQWFADQISTLAGDDVTAETT